MPGEHPDETDGPLYHMVQRGLWEASKTEQKPYVPPTYDQVHGQHADGMGTQQPGEHTWCMPDIMTLETSDSGFDVDIDVDDDVDIDEKRACLLTLRDDVCNLPRPHCVQDGFTHLTKDPKFLLGIGACNAVFVAC
eukprot:118578-Chlamydomonas_euryale.AAC.7